MSAAQLLTELETLGVKVWPDAGALRFKARAGVMTPGLAARLKAAKPELMVILQENSTHDKPRPDLPLLAAVTEFQELIDRLCRMRGHDEAVRRQLHAALGGKAPEAIFPELDEFRAHVARVERETQK